MLSISVLFMRWPTSLSDMKEGAKNFSSLTSALGFCESTCSSMPSSSLQRKNLTRAPDRKHVASPFLPLPILLDFLVHALRGVVHVVEAVVHHLYDGKGQHHEPRVRVPNVPRRREVLRRNGQIPRPTLDLYVNTYDVQRER